MRLFWIWEPRSIIHQMEPAACYWAHSLIINASAREDAECKESVFTMPWLINTCVIYDEEGKGENDTALGQRCVHTGLRLPSCCSAGNHVSVSESWTDPPLYGIITSWNQSNKIFKQNFSISLSDLHHLCSLPQTLSSASIENALMIFLWLSIALWSNHRCPESSFLVVTFSLSALQIRTDF